MKLLIIRPAALGDSLMLIPSLCALKGTAETILVGRRPGIDFLAPYVHQAMDYESHGWHLLYTEEKEQVPHLSLPFIDRAVLFHADPYGKIASRLHEFLPGVPIKVFPGFPPPHAETHTALYLAACLQAFGCPLKAAEAFERAIRVPLLKQNAFKKERRKVIFHPGSGSANKNHPPQFWLDFARRFSESYSFPPTLLLGPAEETLLPFFQEHLQGTAWKGILFCPDRAELFSSLSQASLYAGQDSGITHLAAMIGTPTLALFRSTSVVRWRPLGPKVRIILKEKGGADLLGEALAQTQALLKGIEWL
ncbi:MAG: hypothetical protein JW836_11620 [Deltaproteobacteria bacterium]|nr:hypothetical protein [Deltaproteobacteria bacterium]